VNLTFNSGKNYDFIVKKLPEDKEVWRWSKGKIFTQALMSIMLDPGKEKLLSLSGIKKTTIPKRLSLVLIRSRH